jgi:hypothetical protein
MQSTSWKRISLIASLGFLVGVFWPKFAGLKPGPSAPEAESVGERGAANRADDVLPASTALAASTAVAGSSAVASATATTPTSAPTATSVSLTIGHGVVLSCRTDSGGAQKGKECGDTAALDAFAETRLRRLSTCSDAAEGKLSAVITFDFKQNRALAETGKSTSATPAAALGACLKTHFQGAELASVAHEHTRYVMAYAVTFKNEGSGAVPSASALTPLPSSTASASASPSAEPDSQPSPEAGESVHTDWEPTLIRETPVKGAVIARLSKGEAARVLATQGGWLKIAYGQDFSKEGWVYKNAVKSGKL